MKNSGLSGCSYIAEGNNGHKEKVNIFTLHFINEIAQNTTVYYKARNYFIVIYKYRDEALKQKRLQLLYTSQSLCTEMMQCSWVGKK